MIFPCEITSTRGGRPEVNFYKKYSRTTPKWRKLCDLDRTTEAIPCPVCPCLSYVNFYIRYLCEKWLKLLCRMNFVSNCVKSISSSNVHVIRLHQSNSLNVMFVHTLIHQVYSTSLVVWDLSSHHEALERFLVYMYFYKSNTILRWLPQVMCCWIWTFLIFLNCGGHYLSIALLFMHFWL